MPKLTMRLVDSLEGKAGDYFVWDADILGFGVWVQPTGRKGYVAKYRPLGQRQSKRYTLGIHGVLKTDPARNLARAWLTAVRQGHDPAQAQQDARAAPTVADLAERY